MPSTLQFVRSVGVGLIPSNHRLGIKIAGHGGLKATITASEMTDFLKLRIAAVQPGSVSLELPISEEHTNRLGTLHGGTIASMVDVGGSLALASRGLFSTGVSTDLNVAYLMPGGRVGDMVRVEATCDKPDQKDVIVGKTLAYTSILFFTKDLELIARGSHTKYVATAYNDSRNIVEQLKPVSAKW